MSAELVFALVGLVYTAVVFALGIIAGYGWVGVTRDRTADQLHATIRQLTSRAAQHCDTGPIDALVVAVQEPPTTNRAPESPREGA